MFATKEVTTTVVPGQWFRMALVDSDDAPPVIHEAIEDPTERLRVLVFEGHEMLTTDDSTQIGDLYYKHGICRCLICEVEAMEGDLNFCYVCERHTCDRHASHCC